MNTICTMVSGHGVTINTVCFARPMLCISLVDYIIKDAQLLEVSGNVYIDGTDILGSSDHFHYIVWMELCQATKTFKKRKCVIRKWCLNRFGDDEVKLSYQNALRTEVYRFSENIRSIVERGMKGQELVNEVVMEWESGRFFEIHNIG